MEDTALTRKAIEEIVREMHDKAKQEQQVQSEPKVNPLGKPNKRFLGRTINSMLTHNKRNDRRTQDECQRKLVDLDRKRRKRNRECLGSRYTHRKKRSERHSSESSHEVLSSSSYESGGDSWRYKKKWKESPFQGKRRSESQPRSHRKHWSNYDEEAGTESEEYYRENGGEVAPYVADPSAFMAAASTINHMMHYQAIMSGIGVWNNIYTEAQKSVEADKVEDAKGIKKTSSASSESSDEPHSRKLFYETDIPTIDITCDDDSDLEFPIDELEEDQISVSSESSNEAIDNASNVVVVSSSSDTD